MSTLLCVWPIGRAAVTEYELPFPDLTLSGDPAARKERALRERRDREIKLLQRLCK